MPTLYRTPQDAHADAIQDELEAMVIQHEVVTVSSGADLPDEAPVSLQDLPALADEGSLYTDADAIEACLSELRQVMDEWDKFGADACHLEDDGTVCGPHGVHNDDGPGITAG
jgi:hypothetical protein